MEAGCLRQPGGREPLASPLHHLVSRSGRLGGDSGERTALDHSSVQLLYTCVALRFKFELSSTF